MKTIKNIAYWILILLPLALVFYFYEQMPSEIVMHWSYDGTETYSPKSELYIIAALAPFLAITFEFLPKIDPRKKNYERFEGSYNFYKVIMAFFINLTVGVTISEALNPNQIDIALVVTIFVGLLFVLIGNMMPKFKSNYFIGIRTPWALSNPRVWEKTQRFGGKMFFASGILMVISAFLLKETALFVTIMSIMVICVSLTSYKSYVWYKEENVQGT